MVKNSPASAGDMGSTPHATEQLNPASRLQSPEATTTEACMPESLCSGTRGAPTVRSPLTATREEPPLSATRGKPMRQ